MENKNVLNLNWSCEIDKDRRRRRGFGVIANWRRVWKIEQRHAAWNLNELRRECLALKRLRNFKTTFPNSRIEDVDSLWIIRWSTCPQPKMSEKANDFQTQIETDAETFKRSRKSRNLSPPFFLQFHLLSTFFIWKHFRYVWMIQQTCVKIHLLFSNCEVYSLRYTFT